jgi:hypothetical protein
MKQSDAEAQLGQNAPFSLCFELKMKTLSVHALQDPMVILEKSCVEKLFVKNLIARLDTREYANIK